MKKTPIALQLWSVKDDCRKDFSATVAAVARMGYAGVELAGYGDLDAQKAKAALNAAGLAVAGTHVGIHALRNDLNTVVNDALLFGTRNIVCPSWPPVHYVSAAACETIGAEFDRIGAVLRAYGIRLSFHSHGAEMKPIDGKTVFDWILGAAQPRNLSAEPDVYWIQYGGQSPAKVLRDLGARSSLIHLKDEKEIGLGPVNFQEVFDVVDAIGAVEWYIVEQEAYNHAPLVSVAKCLEQLRAWGR